MQSGEQKTNFQAVWICYVLEIAFAIEHWSPPIRLNFSFQTMSAQVRSQEHGNKQANEIGAKTKVANNFNIFN